MPLAERFMGTEIFKYLDMIKEMSTWPADRIRNWQDRRLRELISHAYQNTTYYREIFDKCGLDPSDIQGIDDLSKIPVLTKSDILNAPQKFLPKNIADIPHKEHATGGSSGDPLQYLLDRRSYNYLTAMRYYHLMKAGYQFGDPLFIIGSGNVVPGDKISLKYKIFYRLNRRINVDGVNMSDEISDRFLKLIKHKKIKYITGYATPIYLLACRAEATNLALPHIRACFTTAEMLHDHYRGKIRSVFRCKVIDGYGAGDGALSAYESEKGSYEAGYNAIYEVDSTSGDRYTGDLLATDLLNFATPFIRYRIGDSISLLNPEDAIKYYNGQIITKIWGRSSEFIRLENGHILTVSPFTHLFRKIKAKAYRIKKVGPMKLECEIQKTALYDQNQENLLKTAFKKHAGADCELIITYVKELKPLASGKRDYFISDTEHQG